MPTKDVVLVGSLYILEVLGSTHQLSLPNSSRYRTTGRNCMRRFPGSNDIEKAVPKFLVGLLEGALHELTTLDNLKVLYLQIFHTLTRNFPFIISYADLRVCTLCSASTSMVSILVYSQDYK